jgi:hypothetical protein
MDNIGLLQFHRWPIARQALHRRMKAIARFITTADLPVNKTAEGQLSRELRCHAGRQREHTFTRVRAYFPQKIGKHAQVQQARVTVVSCSGHGRSTVLQS